MGDKIKKILAVSESAEHSDQIELWTKTFKVFGTLLTDQSKLIEDVVTIKDAKICKHFDGCECGKGKTECSQWLNVFEDQIIAFSILRK